MTAGQTAAIVLAAGLGTRMKSAVPKALLPLAGRPIIRHHLEALERVSDRIVVVVGPGMEELAAVVRPHAVVVQERRLGTGHAALMAADALAGFQGDVLVTFADTPLVTPETLTRMLAARRGDPPPAVVVLGFRPADAGQYGRLVLTADGALERIVEAGDATPEERAIPLCNSGVMAVDGSRLFALLGRIGTANAQKEYYLTDIVALARADGLACAVVEGAADELVGINSRLELACAEVVVQDRLRAAAMADGATLIDPASVYLSHDTRLGRDVTIGPQVVFGPGVTVEDDVIVKAFCHIEGATLRRGAVVGPFARLRPGADIGADAHIGNFVEVKNAVVEAGAKANHLTYLGDARVGAGANVGAGTITCNYDGFAKHRTEIGAGAFIGSNVALVAPVTVGAGAIVGAGSVITRDVAPDALAVERASQHEIRDGALRFRSSKGHGRKAR